MDMGGVKKQGASPLVQRTAVVAAILLGIQFVFGAFTAGLDAGREFNTWPLMEGEFMAVEAVALNPFWLNVVENSAMIQFIHRWLGATVVLAVIATTFLALREGKLEQPSIVLLTITGLQFVLGILTLVNAVPVGLGSLHQAVACLMVLALTWFLYVAAEGSRSAEGSLSAEGSA